MAIAVCVRCGQFKTLPFKACKRCHFDPHGDRRAMAESLMLSDAYYDPEKDYRPGKAELQQAATRIRSGASVEWDEETLAKLSAEQGILERAGSPSWFRIAAFVVALFLLLVIPTTLAVALLVFILHRLM